MRNTTTFFFAVLLTASGAHAELSLPDGWVAGAPAEPTSGELDLEGCCTLGRNHPCCASQRSVNASKPHQIEQLVSVNVSELPVVALTGCSEPDAELPAANRLASDFGLRAYIEGKPGAFAKAKVGDPVRLVPEGLAGAIDARNAGVWLAGDRDTFPDVGSFGGFGVQYQFGAPWKRVDRLTFDSLVSVEDELHLRFFDGSYDMVTSHVGPRCFYDAELVPLVDHWVYGFVGDRDGKRELHVVMPSGRNLLDNGHALDVAFDPLFAHRILPFDESSSVATDADIFEWRHIDETFEGLIYSGTVSVHLTRGARADSPTVLVAQERSRI